MKGLNQGVIQKEEIFLQVDRFISKDLNGGTCMRLIDDLVITEDSRTIYLVVLHPKILPIDYFQLFYSPPKRNRRQWLCKILGG